MLPKNCVDLQENLSHLWNLASQNSYFPEPKSHRTHNSEIPDSLKHKIINTYKKIKSKIIL